MVQHANPVVDGFARKLMLSLVDLARMYTNVPTLKTVFLYQPIYHCTVVKESATEVEKTTTDFRLSEHGVKKCSMCDVGNKVGFTEVILRYI